MNKTAGAWRTLPVIGGLLLCLAAPLAIAGPQEDTEQAETEFARGNLVLSLALWKKAAEQGYAPAQARLGDMLDVSEEDEQAVSWYRKAAAQGNAAGQYGLGEMLAKGEGVKPDPAQARDTIRRAAEQGHLPAVIAMREIYKNGTLGMSTDPALSAEWDAKAKALVAKQKTAVKTAAPAQK